MGCLASRKDTTHRVKQRLPHLGDVASLIKKGAFVSRTKHPFKNWTTPPALAEANHGANAEGHTTHSASNTTTPSGDPAGSRGYLVKRSEP